MIGQYLTARNVADLLDVSTETVLRWTRRGELPATQLPGGVIRFAEDDLRRWLDERATASRGESPAPLAAAQPVGYASSPVPIREED